MKPLTEYLYAAYQTSFTSLQYAIGFSSAAGLGNGVGSIQSTSSFSEGFGQGYVNHFQLAFPSGFLYMGTFALLKKTNNYRLYANIFQTGMSLGLLGWHYFLGTENPLESIIPSATIGFMMVNNTVSEESIDSHIKNE